MSKIAKIFTFITFLSSTFAYGLSMKEAKVFVELSESSTKQCALSASSYEAQIENVLRSNSLEIKRSGSAPTFAFYLAASESSRGDCFGHAYLQVYTIIDSGNLGWTTQRSFGPFEHCLLSFSFSSGSGFEMQEKTNSALADLTRRCVSKILKN